MTGTDPNPTMSQPTRFKVGDRVSTSMGAVGTVRSVNRNGLVVVRKDNGYTTYLQPRTLTRVAPMSAPARTLLAAWHASGRTLNRVDRPNSANRANINWGRATRRYCTPDRSIDLTIAVEVK